MCGKYLGMKLKDVLVCIVMTSREIEVKKENNQTLWNPIINCDLHYVDEDARKR